MYFILYTHIHVCVLNLKPILVAAALNFQSPESLQPRPHGGTWACLGPQGQDSVGSRVLVWSLGFGVLVWGLGFRVCGWRLKVRV